MRTRRFFLLVLTKKMFQVEFRLLLPEHDSLLPSVRLLPHAVHPNVAHVPTQVH